MKTHLLDTLLGAILIAGCSVPTAEATPKPVAMPGKCVAIPAAPADTKPLVDDIDFDADGTTDVLVPDHECVASGSKYDCNYDLYIRRGTCGHLIGKLNLGYEHNVTLEKSTSHGLPDLAIDVYGSTTKYKFDGKKYVGGKPSDPGPAKPRN